MNLRPFEIALISIFVALAIGGVVFLSFFKPSTDELTTLFGDHVTIWGPFSADEFQKILLGLSAQNKAYNAIKYEQYDEKSFNGKLLNAIGQGKSPDLVLIPHTSLVELQSILSPLSYTEYPVRAYRDSFIEGAEIFMQPEGLYAVPFAVDPLVMFWNRDLFSSAGLANPPRTWESLVSQTVPALVLRSEGSKIIQSAIAFGEASNVTYAKDILAMLFFQAGSPIVTRQGESYRSALSNGTDNSLPAGPAVLSFYTQFASPISDVYSWNRSLPNDKLQFLSGKLGLYFARGSDISTLHRENPNLNFDVTNVPQGLNATVKRNFGTFYAFAIPKASSNRTGAFQAAISLTQPSVTEKITAALGLAPVTRISLENGSNDPDRKIVFSSALIARGWLDPGPDESTSVFKRMIEDVTSGQKRIQEAVSDASERLELLYR